MILSPSGEFVAPQRVLTVSGRWVHLGLNREKQRCEVGRIGKFFWIACVCAFENVKGHHSVFSVFLGFLQSFRNHKFKPVNRLSDHSCLDPRNVVQSPSGLEVGHVPQYIYI